MKSIVIRFKGLELKGVLNETLTAQKIYEALPIKSHGNRWGQEFYFKIPVTMELEDGKEVVNKGDIGYWPPGKAMCIFWGPTPISPPDKIIPASAVTIVGKIEGDLNLLDQLDDGDRIEIEKA
ncbi:MAG: cyclophilin-like fold protein [Synergistetes bacterium]|nr:cyclophilin-like fold protein [Synergistota bacterium]MCX8127195.1 cyclophilin-like fold protein [Synergistota bacterium]MDW8191919.1 cyclophilin-like fold protein [Synergistota bacterium]